LYWFIPLGTIEFGVLSSGNSNFSLNPLGGEMQFYENLRYPSSDISYKIDNCPLQKKDDMFRAFEIIENQTLINFYSVGNNEEISVTCDGGARIEEGLFIAGEGGPVNITQSENFNVIHKGSILLIRNSKCENPNIALHELLHALGFDHSSNPNNIMYNFSKCSQTIGEDTLNLLNWLYSFPSYPDLAFENISAKMNGRYLDTNMTIRNNGLADSEKAMLKISADGKVIKELDLSEIRIGSGKLIFIKNVFILDRSVELLEFSIDSNFNELDKNNNLAILEIKK
jgi:hypothetical protein